MKQEHEANTLLTAGEIGSLWETYQYESLMNGGMQYFLRHVNDVEIKKLLKKSLNISIKRVNKAEELMKNRDHPIPEGFTDGDVNLEAARLFSDELYLEYLLHTFQMEFSNYNWTMVTAVQQPIQHFYKEVMKDTMHMEMETKELIKHKGLYVRSPYLPKMKQVSYVKKDSFLSGWFGNRRPLMAHEIEQLVFNSKRNGLGQAIIAAFSQVAENKEVQDFFIKGRELSKKIIRVFTDKLGEEYLPNATVLKTDQVTESTEAPFSDKMMMNLITTLTAFEISRYGLAMSMGPRHDLGVMYTRLTADVAAYANEGAKIMIDNAWLEQPPMAADRKNLSDNKSIK